MVLVVSVQAKSLSSFRASIKQLYQTLLDSHTCSMSLQNNTRFDFIIVGGGTAGNTVASCLAENPNVRVLVLEAGVGVGNSIDNEEIQTPAEAMELRNSKYDWAYKTTMIKRDDYERVEKKGFGWTTQVYRLSFASRKNMVWTVMFFDRGIRSTINR
jgi:cation diffusion facilitator CzcD-associated flavoprotein CzcO